MLNIDKNNEYLIIYIIFTYIYIYITYLSKYIYLYEIYASLYIYIYIYILFNLLVYLVDLYSWLQQP